MEIRRINSFKYLGAIFHEGDGNEVELKLRIRNGTSAGGLRGLLKSKHVSRKAKVRIYRTVIRPVVVYACETWAMTKEMENGLERWERKILRIFGGIMENKV